MTFKVITAPTTEPVSLAEARLQFKASSDTSEDQLVYTWITAARKVAEHYTGRALVPQTLEMALDYFPDYEDDVILLDMPPVQSVTSIKYTDTAGVEQTVNSLYYALSTYGESRKVAPTFARYWPITQRIPDAVRIRYVVGTAVPPVEAKAAILLMVAWLNENRGDTIQPDDIQPPAAKALLAPLRTWGN